MEDGPHRRRRRRRAILLRDVERLDGSACGRSTSTASAPRSGWPDRVASVERGARAPERELAPRRRD